MHKKLFALLITLITFATILTACVLPASQAPKITVAPSTEIPFPLTTQPETFSAISGGTQTAAAITSSPDAETSTSVPTVQTTPLATKQKATAKPTKTPKPTVEVASPTSPARPATYTMRHGEYLICLARRFNVDLNDLFSENGMNMYSRPITGTVLQIPQDDSWNTAYGSRMWHTHPTQYTVRNGDNINTVACYFGDIYPDAILAANNLSSSSLYPGQVLDIP